MTDTLVANDAGSGETMGRSSRALVWVSDTVGYIIYQSDLGDLGWRKTTDGGASWGSKTTLLTATYGVIGWWDVWYDRWTPGISTKRIYVAAHLRTTTTYVSVRFRWLDTDDDSMSTIRTVYTASGQIAVGHMCSITRARDGAFYIVANKTNTTVGFWRSPAGTTWTELTAPTSNVSDQPLLWEGGEADPEDCWCVNWKYQPTYDLVFMVYDQSADSWAEATIAAGIGSAPYPNPKSLAGSMRHSDTHLFVAVFDGPGYVDTGDIRVWEIGGLTSITERAKVKENIAGIFGLSVLFDQGPGAIYVAFSKNSTSSPYEEGEIRYRASSDGAQSWGTEMLYSQSPTGSNGQSRSIRMTSSVLADDKGVMAIVWAEATTLDLYTNLENDIPLPLIPAAVGGPNRALMDLVLGV